MSSSELVRYYFNSWVLKFYLAGSRHLTAFENDIPPLLAFALRQRMADLIAQMITIAHHRTAAIRPPPSANTIIPTSALLKIAKADREAQELFLQKKKRREEAEQAALENSGDGDENIDGVTTAAVAPPKKRKRDGAAVAAAAASARTMSEEVQKRQANTTATMFSGRKMFSWMTPAGASPAASSPSTPNMTKSMGDAGDARRASGAGVVSDTAGLLREEPGVVVMRDALNALESDVEGAGLVFGRGGRSTLRAWAQLRDT